MSKKNRNNYYNNGDDNMNEEKEFVETDTTESKPANEVVVEQPIINKQVEEKKEAVIETTRTTNTSSTKINLANEISNLEKKLSKCRNATDKAEIADMIRLKKQEMKKLDEVVFEKKVNNVNGAKRKDHKSNGSRQIIGNGSNIIVSI